MMHPPQTLLWRLCFALIAIQVVVAIIFGTHAYLSARDFHYQQTVQELQRLASLFEPIYAASDRATLARTVREHGRTASVRITVIDHVVNPGRVLADSQRDASTMDNHLERPEVQAALASGDGFAVRFSDSVLMDMMYYARSVGDDGEPLILRIAVPLTQVHADLRRLLWMLGTAGAGLLLVTVLLVYLVSRAFSRTISSLSEQATELAFGQERGPIEEPSARELAPLAHALNDMAVRLHDRINQLQMQQQEHEAILQSMNSGVIALDLDQRIVRLNRAAEAILGVCLDASNERLTPGHDLCCTGRLLQEVIRSAELNRYVDAVVREDSSSSVEFPLRTRPEMIVQASSSPLMDASGSRVGVLVVLNDVTPLRRLESLRSDFAANVSHELRTPITNIKGYVETMLEFGVEDPEQARGFLDIINRNSDRLAAIVEDILSLAWLEQPGTRQTLQREMTDVGPIVESVAAQFENAAAAKRITLRTDIPAGLAAPMNGQLIEQAIANYVSNAIKYSPSETTVTIRGGLSALGSHPSTTTTADSRWIEISVTDEGPGIAREHLPRIFERFYRVDKARSRELGGTGLGLAIVKHIALVHGGRVDVESRIGQGSTFRIILPASS